MSRMPLTVHGFVVGSAEVDENQNISNVEFLPDDEVPEEAKPYVQMVLAMTLKHISIKEN